VFHVCAKSHCFHAQNTHLENAAQNGERCKPAGVLGGLKAANVVILRHQMLLRSRGGSCKCAPVQGPNKKTESMMRISVFATAAALVCTVSTFAYAQDAGDPVAGKVVFGRCAICHKATKDSGNGLGPNLFGIVGRKSASLPGFEYSGPLKASGITWTDEKLSQWVAGPAKMVPGTKMAFPGITSKGDVRNVVAYLDSLK
jgi:cytochrome c